MTKLQANIISGLINDLTIASKMIAHASTNLKLNQPLWIEEHDIVVLKLREILGVEVTQTYKEIRMELGI